MVNERSECPTAKRTASTNRSASGQVFGCQDKTFHTLIAGEPFDNLRQIGQGDAAVKEMVGLD